MFHPFSAALGKRTIVFLSEFSFWIFHFPFEIMGKGPGLYSDIGKRARGYWFLHLRWIFLSFWLIFLWILLCSSVFFGRSFVQRLPERPQVHHHHLLPHWSCEFIFPLAIFNFWICVEVEVTAVHIISIGRWIVKKEKGRIKISENKLLNSTFSSLFL